MLESSRPPADPGHPLQQLPAENLRTLEGLRVQGGRIASHVLWRSDNITISTDEEVQWLRDEGISTVIDLRASDEVQITGTEVLDRHGVSHVHRAMTRKTADPVTLAKTFKAVTDYEGVGNWYLRLARARAAVLLDCLQDIAEADGGILFYCTAGKDRTGVLAAIVLLFLGADDDVIVEDYEKTGPAIDRVFQRHSAATGRPAPGQQFPDHPMLHAHPASMRTFLRGVHEAGGVIALLGGAAETQERAPGCSVTDLVPRLRKRLVEPS